MRVTIFSDVHGNLPAFETMLKHAGRSDLYICLGDLVNYGPWSNECVDLALSLDPCIYLMGNHEEAFINNFYPGENKLVQQFFQFCIGAFQRKEEIGQFIGSYFYQDYQYQHTVNNSYIYPDTDISLDANYVIGHSHHQFVYHNNGYTLYNAGSVGQNRKFINLVNYIVLEADSRSFKLESVVYDVDLFLNELKSRNYPKECIDYYLNKERI